MRRALRWFYEFWWGEGLADDVPALTYYLVLSIGPFALGLAAVETLLLKDYVSALKVAEQINRYLPEEIHGDVQHLVTGTRENSPYLLVLAIVAMLWTSSGAIGVVERATSRILDGPRHNLVLGRLRNMALGALVAALVVAAAGSATVLTGIADIGGARRAVPPEVILGLNAVGAIVLLAIVYRTAPLGRLHWSSALLGALPAGLAIQVIPNLVGAYVHGSAGFAAVRLFLVLAAILLGLYTMATVILGGAGIAARRERSRATRAPAPAGGAGGRRAAPAPLAPSDR